MTDKQIIKPRPICLYEDTCLHLKEKTRLCEDCIHHKNYWSELLEKEQVEKIKSLEQECEELKNAYTRLNSLYNDNCNFTDKLEQTLTEIKEIAEENFYFLDCYYRFILEKILQKISECEVEDEN